MFVIRTGRSTESPSKKVLGAGRRRRTGAVTVTSSEKLPALSSEAPTAMRRTRPAKPSGSFIVRGVPSGPTGTIPLHLRAGAS